MVSVIIPAYNAEEYLGRCLDSIISQDYSDLEIIVIDDCSKDDTKKVIDSYFKKDSRIKPIFLKKNSGVSAARNKGLDRYTGDYVLFVDSDDYLLPGAITKLVNAAEQYKSDYVDCYNLVILTENNQEKIFTEGKIPKDVLVLGSIHDNPQIFNMNAYIKGKLIDSDLIGKLRFDETLRCYEDTIFESVLKKNVKNYIFLNDVVYVYTRGQVSLNNSYGTKHMCFLDAAIKVKDIYQKESSDIKDMVEAKMISTAYFITINKVIRNDLNEMDNTKNTYDYLNSIKQTFPNYNNNKYLNGFFKHQLNSMTLNSVKRDIKIFKHINFDQIYFNFISLVNKYTI